MAPTLDIDPELLERVNRAIKAIQDGQMVILVDDEDRENEGDLCMAADRVTPEAINFMATHGRGLICLTLTEEQVDRLGLPMMKSPGRGGPPLGTAFTVTIEAREGVTTGISAADRAHTTRIAADPNCKPEDLVTPGHVFPLRARAGGVLVRTGQTEGSVDLARLAKRTPAGVICEIMNDDGSMARMPDLEKFAAKHGLLIVTVADLIHYRMQTERLVRRVSEQNVRLDATGTEWKAVVFEVGANALGGGASDDGSAGCEKREFLALVRGDVKGAEPVLCRMHAGSTLADVFSSTAREGGNKLREALQRIEAEGRGVLVYLPARASLARDLEARAQMDAAGAKPATPPVAGAPDPLREYGLGAQVLADLGVQKIRLLTGSPRRIAGIHGFGLEVVESVALGGEGSDHSVTNLAAVADASKSSTETGRN